MSKTPGPWVVTDEDPPRILATDARATIICITTAPRSNESNMADARLIAAAPELLEALKEIASYEPNGIDSGSLSEDIREMRTIARAAIAKAEGK